MLEIMWRQGCVQMKCRLSVPDLMLDVINREPGDTGNKPLQLLNDAVMPQKEWNEWTGLGQAVSFLKRPTIAFAVIDALVFSRCRMLMRRWIVLCKCGKAWQPFSAGRLASQPRPNNCDSPTPSSVLRDCHRSRTPTIIYFG